MKTRYTTRYPRVVVRPSELRSDHERLRNWLRRNPNHENSPHVSRAIEDINSELRAIADAERVELLPDLQDMQDAA